jgi:hypothetical protein
MVLLSYSLLDSSVIMCQQLGIIIRVSRKFDNFDLYRRVIYMFLSLQLLGLLE